MNKNYKQFSLNLAKKAGGIIKANFNLGMKKEWKKDNTPLTETDLAINQLVLDAIKNNYPEHSVLSEEGDNFKESDEFVWICDPVDGTIPFSHGIPVSTFSLALLRNGQSLLGVIYDPFLDRLFFAEKNKGAYLNNKKIAVSKIDNPQESVIGVEYFLNESYDLLQVINSLRKQQVKVITLTSIAYMGSLVACGELAATIFPGRKPHDTAALKIVVEEAGGKVTDLFGNEQRYDKAIKGHIISNGKLHNQLVKLVKENMGQ
jgi:fructose-1,6-bisphosphatase/inositol monophosphatase family enzyme